MVLQYFILFGRLRKVIMNIPIRKVETYIAASHPDRKLAAESCSDIRFHWLSQKALVRIEFEISAVLQENAFIGKNMTEITILGKSANLILFDSLFCPEVDQYC